MSAKILFSDEKTKHTAKIRRFSHWKNRNVDFGEWILDNAQNEKIAGLVEHCSDWMLFYHYISADLIKLHSANFCRKSLICPLCAIRRAAKNVVLMQRKYEELLKQNPRLKLYYVVLTVKNGVDLTERYTHLKTALQKLISRRRQAIRKTRQNHLSSVFANVTAGAYSIEIKRGRNSQMWHPHANLLLLSETTISKKTLMAEWQELTRDSHITYCNRKAADQKTFIEIFKYALKFADMDYADNWHVFETLPGKRLTGTFGDFRGLKLDDDENAETEDLGEYVELFYKFLNGRYELQANSPSTDFSPKNA